MKTYQHEPACCTGAELILIGVAVIVVVAIGIGGAGIAIVRGGYRWAAKWIREFKAGGDINGFSN